MPPFETPQEYEQRREDRAIDRYEAAQERWAWERDAEEDAEVDAYRRGGRDA